MSRKKIVAGNWKMNTSYTEALELMRSVLNKMPQSATEKIIFPPFPFINALTDLLGEQQGFYTGAQNCSAYAGGAYTGEVSAQMLRSVGCSYVLVGHSERRIHFNEEAPQLQGKIQQAIACGLNVMLCFGEQLAERKRGAHFETVERQLKEALMHFPADKTDALVLAYEPVWAIGTGETATAHQAQQMHAFVRATVATLFTPQVAAALPVLYGGSCNAQNARQLFACPDVDGGLIGGASLKADDFCTIINSF